ncbi:hypothetical protein FA243_29000, partial [Pseudomonas aeruginosa]|nr:hypothetical protein [Pseudomonas aeruginosa]
MDRHAQHHPRSRACVLPNGLRLHLAHDPAASRAAAWLRVAAGSHDEPSAHPGLAPVSYTHLRAHETEL